MAATSPSTATGAVSATTGSANSPSNSPAFLKAAQTVYGDLNSGNYAGAWNTALGTSSMFGTNMNSATTDPLLQALETSQGLQAFDPTTLNDPDGDGWAQVSNAGCLQCVTAAGKDRGAVRGPTGISKDDPDRDG